MIKTKIGGKKGKTFMFKNKFEELDVKTFCDFIDVEYNLGNLEDERDKTEAELIVASIGTPDAVMQLQLIEATLLDLDRQIRASMIELIGLLSKNPKRTIDFILNTKGVNQKHIILILKKIRETLTGFSEWVNRVKPVKTFRFTDYKKPYFWSLTKVREFQVFGTKDQTVLRDGAAMLVARKIDAINTELTANNWSNLPRFLSYVCRPSSEKQEVCTQDKKAFLGGSKIVNLSVDDRLKAYNDKLAETVELRTPIFTKLPLVTAIGIYKQYFFFKSELVSRYKSIYPKNANQAVTKQTIAYSQEVGVEASIEDLREASGYSQAAIFLFSTELFSKELKKFNLKMKAEVAEKEAAYKSALAKSKAENQNK